MAGKIKEVTIDTIQLYLARGAVLHPVTYNQFIQDLSRLEDKNKLSLIPTTIFERFHFKYKKAS